MNTRFSLREVFSQLAVEGLAKPLQEDAALRSVARGSHGSALPWFVKFFVGMSAWIAAILITAFFFIIGIIDEDQALFFGLVFCALAIIINRAGRGKVFFGQLSLAISLTGQILAIVGLYSIFDYGSSSSIVIPVIILELILIGLHRDHVLRFISTIVITTFILVWIFDRDVYDTLHVFILVLAAGTIFIHLEENRLKLLGFEELISPVGSGITVSLLGILIVPLIEYIDLRWEISAVLLFGLLLFTLGQIVLDLGHGLRSRLAIALAAGSILLLVPSISMPGILAALIVLVLGFWRSNRGLIGLSSVFLVFYIWAYYYSLEWTLLVKSLVLMGSGIILLALRHYAERFTLKAGDRP